jgi:hypothetical protein
MSVIILHSNHRHVSATNLVIFSVVTRIRRQIVGINPKLQNRKILVKFRIKKYHTDEYKILKDRKVVPGIYCCRMVYVVNYYPDW